MWGIKRAFRGGGQRVYKVYINGRKPDDIHSTPSKTYKDNGWKGMDDWLGINCIDVLKYLNPYSPTSNNHP